MKPSKSGADAVTGKEKRAGTTAKSLTSRGQLLTDGMILRNSTGRKIDVSRALRAGK